MRPPHHPHWHFLHALAVSSLCLRYQLARILAFSSNWTFCSLDAVGAADAGMLPATQPRSTAIGRLHSPVTATSGTLVYACFTSRRLMHRREGSRLSGHSATGVAWKTSCCSLARFATGAGRVRRRLREMTLAGHVASALGPCTAGHIEANTKKWGHRRYPASD
jgi:hypothetical protein